MIKIEHVVLPSSDQMRFIIEGMRNPFNSWERSDSETKLSTSRYLDELPVGEKDLELMKRLADNGSVHSKYMRMMVVYLRITAPLYWWKEFDTYKVGTVSNSCSTMHTIHTKEFELSDFSMEHLNIAGKNRIKGVIEDLNSCRSAFLDGDYKGDKDVWWQMIQLLPSSFNQTRNIMLNYEVLANIYENRKVHRLDEWVDFCKWIETLPYSEIICGKMHD